MYAGEHVRSHLGELQTMASYACLDATTFEGCINPAQYGVIMGRYDRARDRQARDVGAAAALHDRRLEWDEANLRRVYHAVRTQRAGVCTTFAKAAAYVLAQDVDFDTPTLEIVAYRKHVFVVVGRRGDTVADESTRRGPARQMLPHFSTWGSNWCIVDVWAGAMGWPKVLYHQNEGYPFQTMLNPVERVMVKRPGD